jgi:hypothetical protein
MEKVIFFMTVVFGAVKNKITVSGTNNDID